MTKPLIAGGLARWQFTSLSGDLFFTTDDVGVLQGTAQVFDPYGQVLTTPNAPQAGLPNTTWEAVTGNESEALKTAYQLMGARVYIPALGRFAQLDPKVGGSANGYDYVNQDPVNFNDPSGNESENWLINGLTGLAAFAVGALVAPARGALVGVLVGALAGAAVAGLSHAIEYAVTGQTEFSATRLGISILAGALGGGIVGRVKWAKAQNRVGGNVNGGAAQAGDTASVTSYQSSSYDSGWTSRFSKKMEMIYNRDEVLAAKTPPRVSLQIVDDMPMPNGWRESQLSYSMKTVVKQSDPNGIRAWMKASSVMDGLCEGAGSFRPASVESSYSLASSVRVSQQLDRMSFGSKGDWL